MIGEEIFSPTYLYIKQHRVTGLKYLGKTVKNPLHYSGSGKYWLRHLKKHGLSIDTLWSELFTDKTSLVETALRLSKEHNIVASEEWANQKPENGLDGAISGEGHHFYGVTGEDHPRSGTKHTAETKQLMKTNHADFSKENHPLWGIGHTEETRIKMCLSRPDLSGENNPSYGRYWWTDGIESVKAIECPAGWVRGMGIKQRQKCRTTKG